MSDSSDDFSDLTKDLADQIKSWDGQPGTIPADLAALVNTDHVRRDCAFCLRERSAHDDNHAPDCPYWELFGLTPPEVG